MELLSGLEIGDALEQDCRVNEQDRGRAGLSLRLLLGSSLSHRLDGSIIIRSRETTVNVDELDYLTKRLDSFCDDEAERFQAMAHKLGLLISASLI